MKLGVLTALYSDRSLAETLALLDKKGIQAVELGAGGVVGSAHCDPDVLLNNEQELQKFKDTFKPYEIIISALACHENVLHPNEELRKKFTTQLKNNILLAEKLGVPVVNNFSGCPGEPGGKYPNWIVQPWPEDFERLYEWQWEKELIPYWKEMGQFAADHGVKVALEMHPGFSVYNPETVLKLRNATHPSIGCNFDPSNIVWQDIDVPTALRELKDCIFHFHAKDSIEVRRNIAKNGRLDAKNYNKYKADRQWLFRTVGYGHDEFYWKQIMSTLVDIGYDYVISIEHEDTYMSQDEGLDKAVAFLKNVIIFEKAGEMTWANVDRAD
ncbi:MAG: sugar phosphate isomerase/epimerase family protein [Saccharofermentanales bacterium]|jgi:sugar phosphate isomerase/epimerase